ncbi:RAS2 protein [Pestalotiopsis sp. IQ-011]
MYLAVGPSVTSKAQIAAAVLVFVNGLLLLLVSHAEHTRSVSPSTLINVYLVFTLLFDCVIVRTLWLLRDVDVVAKLFTSAAVTKLLVLAVEAWEKRSILLAQYRELSPEATSGILNRTVFWWLNPLMKAGFGRLLTDQDLFPIHDSLDATKLLDNAQRAWSSANKSKKNALFGSTLLACKWVFLSGVLPRLCLIALKYTQPFLIERTTGFTGDLSQPDEIGWGLTGAWLVVFLGLAICNGFYYHMTYRFVTAARGSLCGMIYCKTLDLSATALDESIAVTLMSTDTENICLTFANLHEVWASPVECGVALYLLYRNLGLAALTPMTVTIIATMSIMQLARFMGNAQRTWIRGTQTRVDVTASMLGSMKEVKMLGLSDLLTKTVQKLRVKELNLASKYRRLLSFRVFLGSSTQTIAPLATFATFVIVSRGSGQPLDVASAYSSLSLIYLLSDPIAIVIRTIPMLSAAKACFERIHHFLLSESCDDMRQSLSQGSSEDAISSESTRSENPASRELQNLETQPALYHGAPLMMVSDASFGWSFTEPPILKDISCTVRSQHFTFVIGNVGSGKSTLMKALLGEIRQIKGSIYTGLREVALASQEPWIQNLTIRENILGAATYNKAWYDRVISACSLEQDILELPNQDETKTGSAGVSLSGGQKQRVTLARAVYSRKKVVFLDDVFAGQDAGTEEHIYQNLFAKDGLFRETGTTVVCITNTRSFQELQSNTNYLQGLQIKQNGIGQVEGKADSSLVDRSVMPRRQTPEQQPAATTGFVGELATYGYYLGSSPWWYSILFGALIIFYSAGFKSTELLLSFWTGRTNTEETNNFYLGFYGMLSGIAIAGITGGAYFWLTVMVPLNSEVLHARLLNTVMGAPLSFFSNTDVGVTTNRFSQDMSVIDTELPYTLIDFALNITTAVMAAVLMCVFSGYFAATLPPIILFCWLLQKFYLKTSRQIRLLDLEAKSPLFTQFLDLLQGLSSVRAFAWQDRFKERYLNLLDASQRPYYLLFCIQRWLGLVLDLMVAVLATILMVLVVKLRVEFSPRFVALAVLNVTSFSQSLAHVIKDWTQLETSFGAVARVKQFCGETEREDLPHERDPVPESWPSRGHISIKNLTAAYTSDGEPVLHNINLDIPAGSTVGICGRSGSGKSSLMACLLRMMEVGSDSRIEIDGIDITSLPRQAVRAAVAVVPQHPFFLKNTNVRGNLVPIGQQADERILAVLHRLEMRDAIERMGGLDSMLDMDRLSQGQRQLLCLARAVLADKRIIVLDEASSNVDERSERLIRQVIREQFVGCTVIAVAHRLGAVADFDRVAVMGGGRILEWDSPRALLGRSSEFKRLWDLGPG